MRFSRLRAFSGYDVGSIFTDQSELSESRPTTFSRFARTHPSNRSTRGMYGRIAEKRKPRTEHWRCGQTIKKPRTKIPLQKQIIFSRFRNYETLHYSPFRSPWISGKSWILLDGLVGAVVHSAGRIFFSLPGHRRVLHTQLSQPFVWNPLEASSTLAGAYIRAPRHAPYFFSQINFITLHHV